MTNSTETLKAYDVDYLIAGNDRHSWTKCITEEGRTTTDDFAKMIAIKRGVAESDVEILSIQPGIV